MICLAISIQPTTVTDRQTPGHSIDRTTHSVAWQEVTCGLSNNDLDFQRSFHLSTRKCSRRRLWHNWQANN